MTRPSKLTDNQREDIRRLHNEVGVTYKDLALQFEVSYNTILRICNPDIYQKHLQGARKYQKENQKKIVDNNRAKLRRYFVVFNKQDDAEVISHIDAKENMSQYIKDLIVSDMEASKSEQE